MNSPVKFPVDFLELLPAAGMAAESVSSFVLGQPENAVEDYWAIVNPAASKTALLSFQVR